MLSNFFAPYILQPTRPASKSLIDNIFLDTIDYPSKSGNLKIQLADQLLQFVLLEFSYEFYSNSLYMDRFYLNKQNSV